MGLIELHIENVNLARTPILTTIVLSHRFVLVERGVPKQYH